MAPLQFTGQFVEGCLKFALGVLAALASRYLHPFTEHLPRFLATALVQEEGSGLIIGCRVFRMVV